MYSLSVLDSLSESYSSPLYIFRRDDFARNYQSFFSIFRREYSRYNIGYSYKTNYTPYICSMVKAMGGYAEVVSDMELWVARNVGYTPDKIIYNGPCKGSGSIELMLEGGIVNADNLEETAVLCSAAANSGRQLKIGLRVNIDIGQKFVSRFGMDAPDIDKAFAMVNGIKNLSIAGLHCHIGQSRTIEAWVNRSRLMLQLADRYFESAPEYLDLGSGMFAVMDPFLARQFGDDIPSFEDYAKAALGPIRQHYDALPEEKKPIIFTEPGTTLVNSYTDFAARVTSIKHIKGRTFIILNCSKHNLGDVCSIKQLPINVVKASASQTQCTDACMTGYTCLEHDVMFSGFTGSIGVGDYVVFGNVGGYSNVSKPPFISQNCAMISLDRQGNTEIIKKAEAFGDVFSTYIFKEHKPCGI